MFEPVTIVVSRPEVETRDISNVTDVFKSCLSSVDRARSLFEKLDIAFHGYDDDTRELSEIPEVREYVQLLDDKFPYWLFFLTKSGLGLQCVMYCLMPPTLSEKGRQTVLPKRLDELLSNRWFPAMDGICAAVGFSEAQIETLTNHVVDYFFKGPSAAATR